MKIYQISKGQLATILVFSVLAWFVFTIFALDKYDASAFDFLPTLFIPAILIFYGIGWRKAQPKKDRMKILITDEATANIKFFYSVPLWKFLLLSVFSLGIYDLVWAGRNWISIQKQVPEKKISPAWRGLFLIFFLYPLAKKIYGVARLKGYHAFGNPTLVTVIFVFFTLLSRAELEWAGILSFGTVFAFIPLINSIEYIHKSGDYEINDRFNAQDWIMLMIGPLLILIPFLYGLISGPRFSEINPQSHVNQSIYEEGPNYGSVKPIQTAEEKFNSQITNANMERKCQTEAHNAFQRDGLPGYSWQAHWNKRLEICVLEMTGWDTELQGVWNTWLWDVGGQESYGTLTINNSRVAAGVQNKNENPAKNGEIQTCKLGSDINCSTIEEYYSYRDQLMQE